jgi:hypothetical protein
MTFSTERELQDYLVKGLRENGFWAKTTSRNTKNSAKGVPDVLACDLLSPNRTKYFFECKGPKTPLSEEQERAVRLGAVVIVRDKETADKIIRREWDA